MINTQHVFTLKITDSLFKNLQRLPQATGFNKGHFSFYFRFNKSETTSYKTSNFHN